jgi:hypothetical protein
MLSIHKFSTFCHSNVHDVARHALGTWCYSHYALEDIIDGTFCSWGHLMFEFFWPKMSFQPFC